MKFKITVSATGLANSTGNSAGFIEPIKIEQYRHQVSVTGKGDVTGLLSDDTFNVYNTSLTVGANTTIANLVILINKYTVNHHAVASASGNKLSLIAAPGFEHIVPHITGITTGVLKRLGWEAVDYGTAPTFPSTIAIVEAKARGYQRWLMVLESLEKDAIIENSLIVSNNGTISTDPTEIIFSVTVPDSYYVYRDDGVLLTADAAIKYAVARALTLTEKRTSSFFDPTYVLVQLGPQMQQIGTSTRVLTVGALDTLAKSLAAVTVEKITP